MTEIGYGGGQFCTYVVKISYVGDMHTPIPPRVRMYYGRNTGVWTLFVHRRQTSMPACSPIGIVYPVEPYRDTYLPLKKIHKMRSSPNQNRRLSSRQSAATSFRNVTDGVRSSWIMYIVLPLDVDMGQESGLEQIISCDGVCCDV